MFRVGQTVILKKAEGKRCSSYDSAHINTPTGSTTARYCEGMRLIITDVGTTSARVSYPGRKQRTGNWVELHHLVPAIQLKRRKNV